MAADDLMAVVAGGGIGGLAAAVALAQAGWRVTVLERAPEFGEVGAGLATTGNGMTALAALGLAEAARAVAYQTGTAGLQDSSGRWIMRMPDTRSDTRAVTTIWGLQRQRLHGVLRAAAEAAGDIELVTAPRSSPCSQASQTATRRRLPGGRGARRTGPRPTWSSSPTACAARCARSCFRQPGRPTAAAPAGGRSSRITTPRTGSSRPGDQAPSSARYGSARPRSTGTGTFATPRGRSSPTSSPPRASGSRPGHPGFATWSARPRPIA